MSTQFGFVSRNPRDSDFDVGVSCCVGIARERPWGNLQSLRNYYLCVVAEYSWKVGSVVLTCMRETIHSLIVSEVVHTTPFTLPTTTPR